MNKLLDFFRPYVRGEVHATQRMESKWYRPVDALVNDIKLWSRARRRYVAATMSTRRYRKALPMLLFSWLQNPEIVLKGMILLVFWAISLVLRFIGFLWQVFQVLLFILIVVFPFHLARPFLRRREPLNRKRVVLATISDVSIDIRIEKYVKTLTKEGFDVHVIGATDQVSEIVTGAKHGATYVQVPCRREEFYLYWRYEHFIELVRADAEVYHANDLTSLLVCYYAALVNGSKVVFDAHEVWAENVDFNSETGKYERYPLPKRVLMILMERYYARRVDYFTTVNDVIAKRYEKIYWPIRTVDVVRNVPQLQEVVRAETSTPAERLKVPENAFLLGYIGGLGPSRNVESVIQALEYCDPRVHFLVMGPYADYWRPGYEAVAQKSGVMDRVHILQGVGMNEVFRQMKTLDAGIVMLQKLCMNFYLYLPNKVFEYMASEIPLLVSDFPVIGRLVKETNVGLAFDPHDPKDIARAVNAMAALSPSERKSMGARGRQEVHRRLHWESEVQPLVRKLKEWCLV